MMDVDETESFQLQALEITPIGDDFDPSKKPQSGEEYLKHMLYERKHCPAVVVNRPKKLVLSAEKDSHPLEEQELSCTDILPDSNLLPTIEWKNVQSCNFIRARSKIMMVRQHLANHNYDNSLEPPMITDDLAWFKFCQQHQPLLSIILRFNQRILEQLLGKLNDWVKGDNSYNSSAILDLACSDLWLGDWLYAVLACLHLPLEPDVHSTLRDIAKTFIQLRSCLESHEHEKAIPYNLFIYLIGKIPITPAHRKQNAEIISNMDFKRFHVKICLKLETVTCPGVWLCSHGYLEVTIKVLGYFFRTGAMEPYFPVLCHDRFKMEGYFKTVQSIAQLLSYLSREHLEITLWQNSRRLAYYEGVLMDLLQYIEPKLQCPHTNTRQLLMKTTPAFPGIIAPKIEITSNFVIKDKILNLCNTSDDLRTCTNILRRPQNNAKRVKYMKTIQYQRPCVVQTVRSEDLINTQHRIRKQKTVCHTRELKDAINKVPNGSLCTKPQGSCVSNESSCSTDNTQTSEGICDIELDGHQDKSDGHNHEQFCELCRLYKEVFSI